MWEGSACETPRGFIHSLSGVSIPNNTCDLTADIEIGSELKGQRTSSHFFSQSKCNISTHYNFWNWPIQIISRSLGIYVFCVLNFFISRHGLY